MAADASHLAQTIGFGLDHIEHLGAKRLDQLPSVDRADTTDHPGTEVLLDALGRRWRRGAQEAGLELLPVGAVVDPLAACCDPFAGGDARGVPNDGYQVTVAARLDAKNAEAVFGIVERDALDEAGEASRFEESGRGFSPTLTKSRAPPRSTIP